MSLLLKSDNKNCPYSAEYLHIQLRRARHFVKQKKGDLRNSARYRPLKRCQSGLSHPRSFLYQKLLQETFFRPKEVPDTTIKSTRPSGAPPQNASIFQGSCRTLHSHYGGRLPSASLSARYLLQEVSYGINRPEPCTEQIAHGE